jgi:hypothetical protein
MTVLAEDNASRNLMVSVLALSPATSVVAARLGLNALHEVAAPNANVLLREPRLLDLLRNAAKTLTVKVADVAGLNLMVCEPALRLARPVVFARLDLNALREMVSLNAKQPLLELRPLSLMGRAAEILNARLADVAPHETTASVLARFLPKTAVHVLVAPNASLEVVSVNASDSLQLGRVIRTLTVLLKDNADRKAMDRNLVRSVRLLAARAQLVLSVFNELGSLNARKHHQDSNP